MHVYNSICITYFNDVHIFTLIYELSMNFKTTTNYILFIY